jgi:hypothetical protein
MSKSNETPKSAFTLCLSPFAVQVADENGNALDAGRYGGAPENVIFTVHAETAQLAAKALAKALEALVKGGQS